MNIPKKYFNIKYTSSRIPGVKNQLNLTLGANCQVFAYALLKENGITIPNFRSSHLWEDDIYTEKVTKFKPFDLMLYSIAGDAYGAHVGLYIGEGKIIHLSADNVYAEIISHEDMLKNEKYSFFIGAKRVFEKDLFF